MPLPLRRGGTDFTRAGVQTLPTGPTPSTSTTPSTTPQSTIRETSDGFRASDGTVWATREEAMAHESGQDDYSADDEFRIAATGEDPYATALGRDTTAMGQVQAPAGTDEDPWARDEDGEILRDQSGDAITKTQLRNREYNLSRGLQPGSTGYRPDGPEVYEGPNGEALNYDPYVRNPDGTIREYNGLKVLTDRYSEEYGAEAGLVTDPSDYYDKLITVGDIGPEPGILDGGTRLPGEASAHRLAAATQTPEEKAEDEFFPEWYRTGTKELIARGEATSPEDIERNEATDRALGLSEDLGLRVAPNGDLVTRDGRVVSSASGGPTDFDTSEAIETQGVGRAGGGGEGGLGDLASQLAPEPDMTPEDVLALAAANQIDETKSDESREMSRLVFDKLIALAEAEEGPSAAEALLLNAQERAERAIMGRATAQGGSWRQQSSNLRQAGQDVAIAQGDAGAQLSALRAREEAQFRNQAITALQSAGVVSTNMRGQDIQISQQNTQNMAAAINTAAGLSSNTFASRIQYGLGIMDQDYKRRYLEQQINEFRASQPEEWERWLSAGGQVLGMLTGMGNLFGGGGSGGGGSSAPPGGAAPSATAPIATPPPTVTSPEIAQMPAVPDFQLQMPELQY